MATVLLTVCIVTALAYSAVSFRLEDIADGKEELLDLSLEFSEETPYWPSLERKGQNFKIRETQNGHNEEHGYYYHANVFSTSDHGGTHVDALNHVNQNPLIGGIEQTPLSHFFGMASVIDISAKCARNADYQLTVDDVRQFEDQYGRLPNGSHLFIYTGWGSKIHNKTAFWGTADYMAGADLHYPGVSAAAAEWIVRKRGIKTIGVETGSVDCGRNGMALSAHSIFLSGGINVIESVQKLDKMPPKGAFVFGLPMKIKSSGSPIRLVAVGWKKHPLIRPVQ